LENTVKIEFKYKDSICYTDEDSENDKSFTREFNIDILTYEDSHLYLTQKEFDVTNESRMININDNDYYIDKLHLKVKDDVKSYVLVLRNTKHVTNDLPF
jgi:hypothetical protein